MAECKDFAQLLKLKKEEREKKFENGQIDPVHIIERNLSAKRKPLLGAENTPKKARHVKESSEITKSARREKLARLAQNIREMDAADRGESVKLPQSNNINILLEKENETKHASVGNEKRSMESKGHTNPKWARLAQERAVWESDFKNENNFVEKESKIIAVPKTSDPNILQHETSLDKPPLKPSRSAKDMVADALRRAGKSAATESTTDDSRKNQQNVNLREKNSTDGKEIVKPEPTFIKSKADASPITSKRIEELNAIEKSEKVSNLIKGFSPKPEPKKVPKKAPKKAPKKPPAEKRHQQETLCTTKEEKVPKSLPKPSISNKLETQPSGKIVTPHTKADLEIASMKKQIDEARRAIEEGRKKEMLQKKKTEKQIIETELDDESFEMDCPVLCSTHICDQNPHENVGNAVKADSTNEPNITGYKKGHSLTFVRQIFDFLPESTLPELKEELTCERDPEDIRNKIGKAVCFEAGDTPDKMPRKKRRSASFCMAGSADDMVEFTAKSLQSFRKTQRLKRYEAKATARSIFSSELGTPKINLSLERKRLKQQIDTEVNIIRQTSAALSICTDKKHGKGTFTQVDAEKLLLVAYKKHEIAKVALANLEEKKEITSQGRIIIGDIVLKIRYQETFEAPQLNNRSYWFMATIQVGNELYSSKLDPKMEIKDVKNQKTITIPVDIVFDNVPIDFDIIITIYSIDVDREIDQRTKEKSGLKLFGGKISMFNQKSSKKNKAAINPALLSPGGPSAVRKSNFKSIGYAKINLESAKTYDHFKLNNTSWDSIIQSIIFAKVEPKFTKSFIFESFITIRTGRAGYNDWVRYWGVLCKDRITFWKYPEDKEDLPSEGHISLKYVVSPTITSANPIMTRRPNTIELYHAPPKPGFRKNPNHINGVVSHHDKNKLVRFLLSADTAQSKQEWIDALNQMIKDLSAWEPTFPAPIEDTLAD